MENTNKEPPKSENASGWNWNNHSLTESYRNYWKFRDAARPKAITQEFKPTTLKNIVYKNIQLKNKSNQMWYHYAIPSGISSLTGVTIYRMLRRRVQVYEGAIFGAFLTACFTWQTTKLSLQFFVEESQLNGNNCIVCMMLKSSLCQGVSAIVIPSIFSAGLVGFMNERYSSGSVEQGSVKAVGRYWLQHVKPIYRRLAPFLLLNLFVACYCAVERQKIIDEAVTNISKEDYDKLVNAIAQNIHQLTRKL